MKKIYLSLLVLAFGWAVLISDHSQVAPASAGGPPSEALPWDTAWVVDTIPVQGSAPVLNRRPVLFITRDVYESEFLGISERVERRKLQHDLEAVKKVLQAKKKAGGP